ncbi:uncharacterized protein LOC125226618 [Leguminivora glycinivorella]|uniref:uncharacterized protein LOC125226618 n=1 Tax=Leguminivora glycinivorella TaxID=1035111 RepID=UPI00200CD39D|nr:uncharacterized protein LOC125226618 [Leguminivora glycinivorella]
MFERALCFAVLSIVCQATFALADSSTTPITTLPPIVAPTPLSSCQKLNSFTEIYSQDSPGFVNILELCNEEPKDANSTTQGTSVLLKVYNEIKGEQCSFTYKMDQKLIKCVNKELGFDPELTAEGAKSHFGRNGTRALRFEDQECVNAVKVRECVEKIFSEKRVASEMLGCKKAILRGFNITANICKKKAQGRGQRGSGMKYLPSNYLIMGTTIMVVKFTLSFIS